MSGSSPRGLVLLKREPEESDVLDSSWAPLTLDPVPPAQTQGMSTAAHGVCGGGWDAGREPIRESGGGPSGHPEDAVQLNGNLGMPVKGNFQRLGGM